jgi:hypothetical protein
MAIEGFVQRVLSGRRARNMVRSIQLTGAALIALALAAPAADAQTTETPTIHARAKHHARKKTEPEGRQITVHKATPSYLTLGGVASPAVTSTNNYVIDTFDQPTPVEGTFLGSRGREALGRYDNSGFPLFRF